MYVKDIMTMAPVIPVLVIDDERHAVPLARALVAGGLPVLEVTLRTGCALAAVERMVDEVSDAIVGVGTVTEPGQLTRAKEAGARFAVSPGLTSALCDAARSNDLPFLPGVMTPSDVMHARAAGLSELKFFPAQAAGGVGMLKSLSGPFPEVLFCPTGGITADTFRDFIALDNVACVGGSWLAPRAAVIAEDWDTITRLAQACAVG